MIPDEFQKETALIGINPNDSSFTAAKKIIQYMNNNYGKGRGLGYSSVEILNKLKNKEGGACSDYSSVFTALCLAINIRVREWGLVENLKYKIKGENLGHSFNEIFYEKFNKWVLVDAYYGIYFENKDNNLPLAASELIDFHMGSKHKIKQVNFLQNRPEYKLQVKINNCYYRDNLFFLLKNYNIFSQDKILSMHNNFPLPLLHFLLILFNKYYTYIIYLNTGNINLVNSQLKKIFKFNYTPTPSISR